MSQCINESFLDENSDSFRFLAHANNTSEWMWKIYFKFMAASLIVDFIVLPLIFNLFSLINSGNLSVANFFHPTPFVYEKITLQISFFPAL